MSWAEKRTTTLKEDKVYCLLGIFGVFLSLIYGEGEKYATLRLEEEIQKRHPYPTTPATTTAASNPKRLRTVVFSPDGKLVLSASLDKTVCLWDVAREKKTPYRLEDCYIDSIGQVAFSPKDSLVALAPEDSTANTVILWDATSGEVLHLLKGHNDRVESVVFSPDGELLASSSSDKTAILWYTATGKVRWTLSGHKDKVRAVAFSPNRERPMIASASGDKTVRLWDVTTGESMQTLRGHVASVRAIVFSPNGELVASASEDKTVRIWNAKTSAAIQAPSNHTRCGDMGVLEYEQSQSGRLDAQRRAGDLCTRDQEGAALEGSHNLVAYTREPSQQRQGNQALDRQQTSTVCTLEQNSKAVVWGNKSSQPFTNRQIGTENIKGKNPMTLEYCPTNNVVNLEGSQQPNQRRPFSLERRVPGQNGRPSRPDAQRAQRAQQSGRSKSSKDNAIFIFKAHKDKNKDRVNAVAFSPDNKVMASASVDGTILLWSASTGAVLVEFKCRPVSTLQFSKDGLYLQTDCGLLSIGSREASVNPQSSQQTNAILIKGNCIYRGEERVQLSPDDQPFCSAFRGNVLALGLPSGMVKFIKS
ncbi:WD40-repeat-containing domain protein [Paraphoma chrysanthemicola]|nr:WD40-repeat-containing domain protein [Paraphoma chrysanthemicola]